MKSQQRRIGVTVLVACVAVGFIVAGLATDRWIYSRPAYLGNDTASGKHNAAINFGLFTGFSLINYGFSERPINLKIACDVSEQVCSYFDLPSTLLKLYKNQTNEDQRSIEWFGLFSFPLYVATLVTVVLAIISASLAIGFGAFNVFGRPVETITGPSGLYLWNILALVLTATSLATYLGLYFYQFKKNILKPYDLNSQFTSKDHTVLDYSFYFVVAAALCFVVNIFLLLLSGQKCSCHYSLTGEKEVDNGMILY